MQNHAGQDIIEKFEMDVEAGRIEIITEKYLRSIGMFRECQILPKQ